MILCIVFLRGTSRRGGRRALKEVLIPPSPSLTGKTRFNNAFSPVTSHLVSIHPSISIPSLPPYSPLCLLSFGTGCSDFVSLTTPANPPRPAESNNAATQPPTPSTSLLFQAPQFSYLGDVRGKAAVSSVCLIYTLRVISWWMFWLLNLQLLQEQWWLWHSSFEVIKLSAHLCSNFHNIFKGHRMLLIFVPLHFYLLRDLLSSWTLLKQVFQKLASERGH